jgi:hypothetical protein
LHSEGNVDFEAAGVHLNALDLLKLFAVAAAAVVAAAVVTAAVVAAVRSLVCGVRLDSVCSTIEPATIEKLRDTYKFGGLLRMWGC